MKLSEFMNKLQEIVDDDPAILDTDAVFQTEEKGTAAMKLSEFMNKLQEIVDDDPAILDTDAVFQTEDSGVTHWESVSNVTVGRSSSKFPITTRIELI